MLYYKMFEISAFVLLLILVSFNLSSPEAKDIKVDVPMLKVQEPQYMNSTINTYYDVPLEADFQDFIIEECNRRNVDPELVLAIMSVESDFQSDVISGTDDYGIMQINIANHSELKEKLGITNFLNPYESATAGIYLLNQYQWCESEEQMLMCYNMGITGAKEAWSNGIYETQYVQKVMKAKKEIGESKYEIKVLFNQDIE